MYSFVGPDGTTATGSPERRKLCFGKLGHESDPAETPGALSQDVGRDITTTGHSLPDYLRRKGDQPTEDLYYHFFMCRNIKPLFNFDPPVTPEEVRAASLQFVRKISGFTKPSKANEDAFNLAIDEVAAASMRLLVSLETTAAPKNREEEAAKAKARSAQRFSA
jgi:hypothetical protein